jgi:hypothetical protein
MSNEGAKSGRRDAAATSGLISVDAIEEALKNLHSPRLGDSPLATSARIGEIVRSAGLEDSPGSRAVVLSALIEDALAAALAEASSERTITALEAVRVTYVDRETARAAAKKLKSSVRSMQRYRAEGVFLLTKEIVRELGLMPS